MARLILSKGGAGGVELTGISEAISAFRRLDKIVRLAKFPALRKTAVLIRGKVRRAISEAEQVQLQTLRHRVAWFWRGARNSKTRNIKFWVGTKYEQVAKKADVLVRGESRKQRRKKITRRGAKIDISDSAAVIAPKECRRAMHKDFPRLYKSQLTRKLATFRG